MNRSGSFARVATLLSLFSARAWAIQPSDWPVWGQNPGNTRANVNEISTPPATFSPTWSFGPGSSTTSTNAGPMGVRFGIIADGGVYGSGVAGNQTFIQGHDVLTGLKLAGWGAVFPKVVSGWSYFPPSFVQGRLAFGFGWSPANPCSQPTIRTFSAATGNAISTINMTPAPQQYGSRHMYAGTAVESTGYFYTSGLCTVSNNQPVRTTAFSVPSGLTFKTWTTVAPVKPYKQFTTGDVRASWAPAVDSGRVALALARPAGGACTSGTARIQVFDDTNGNDLCTVGPFVTTFDETPPAMVGTRIYSVNFLSLGPTAFDLSACLAGGGGSCNLITGSAGPGNGSGLAVDVAAGLVITSGGFSIQSWNADMSGGPIDVFTTAEEVSPYVALANGHVYAVTKNTGKPFAVAYNAAGNFGVSTPLGDTSPTGPFGVSAIGEGVLVVSGPTEVRGYVLSPPASLVTPPICPPGTFNAILSLDSAFDHTTGLLQDARIMGLTFNGAGAFNGQFGMVYNSATDQWLCFPGMSVPPSEACPAVYSTAISVFDGNETWVAGHSYGVAGCDNSFVWEMFPSLPPTTPTWSAPMQGVTPALWSTGATAQNGIAMIRGVPGPRTGWTGVNPGSAYFNGVSWSDPIPTVGGGMLNKISFPYGDAANGWSALTYQLGYLDTINYPAPGQWVFTNLPAGVTGFGVQANAANDVWACGVDAVGLPSILHTTTPGTSGGVPAPVPGVPPPTGVEGNPSNFPSLFDITFYELDPLKNKGVAVGGDLIAPAGFGPLVYITKDHGVTWTYVPVPVPANYFLVQLRAVRFVSANLAYAVGLANDTVTGRAIPLLVRIAL